MSNQIYLSVLKTTIQKSLNKNLPLILEDVVQYLENHNFQVKRRKKPLQKKPESTQQIKEKYSPHQDNKIESFDATIPYFNESGSQEKYECLSTIPYFNESGDYKSTQEYDCPPESWEDVGFGYSLSSPKPEMDKSRLEDATSSNPITVVDQCSDDYLSIFDQLEGSLYSSFEQVLDVQRQGPV